MPQQNRQRRRSGFGFGASSLTGPGTAFTIGFIVLAVGMGILLSRGFTPKSVLSDPGQSGELEVIQETPSPDQKGLQLKTLKFKECGSKLAVGLLVDRSGSMDGKKLLDLKVALSTFATGLSPQSVVGLYSFSSFEDGATETTENVPFGRFETVKNQLTTQIHTLVARGSTHTRAGFQLIKDKLIGAQKDFPDQQFSMILLSDGIPEDHDEATSGCPSGRKFGNRCFALTQDPTQPPDLAREIRDAGISVYSIAIYSKTDPSDNYFLPDMRNMMQKIASEQKNYYEVPDSSQLKNIYKEIAQKICEEVK